jgi:uncharacterized membrane protein YciS (DUF1049 family)
MSLAFKRLKVYVRCTLIVAAAVAIGLVLVKNRDNQVAFWFFGLTEETGRINVVWLMLCTAVGTLVSWWVFSFGWGLWREVREVRRLEASKHTAKELEKRETELNKRERRIDESLKRAITHEEDHGD